MGFVISHVMGNADLGWVYTVVKIKRPKKLRRGESGWVFLRCRNWKKGRDGAGARKQDQRGVGRTRKGRRKGKRKSERRLLERAPSPLVHAPEFAPGPDSNSPTSPHP